MQVSTRSARSYFVVLGLVSNRERTYNKRMARNLPNRDRRGPYLRLIAIHIDTGAGYLQQKLVPHLQRI